MKMQVADPVKRIWRQLVGWYRVLGRGQQISLMLTAGACLSGPPVFIALQATQPIAEVEIAAPKVAKIRRTYGFYGVENGTTPLVTSPASATSVGGGEVDSYDPNGVGTSMAVRYHLVGKGPGEVRADAPITTPTAADLVPPEVLNAATGGASASQPTVPTFAGARVVGTQIHPPAALPGSGGDAATAAGKSPQNTKTDSGVLVNDDPAEVRAQSGEPGIKFRLTAIISPLTIAAPDLRGIPRSFEVGSRLPDGSTLRSIDVKTGCANTDRGSVCLN